MMIDSKTIIEDFAKYVDFKSIKSFEGSVARSEESFMREQEGRNCTVFERTRFYAYAVLKSFNFGFSSEDSQNFYNAVFNYAEDINQEFESPLGIREIRATVKSIVNWTLMHFGNASEKKEFEKKDIGGDKSRANSIKTRSATKQKNIEKAVALKAEGKTVSEISQELGRSERMVEYYLEEYKKYLQEHPEVKEELQEIRETLIWWGSLQFVISDIFRLYGVCVLLKYVGLLLDSS